MSSEELISDSLNEEITEYLKNTPEKLSAYEKLIQDFRKEPENPLFVFNSITDLIKDNSELLAKFNALTEEVTKLEEPIEIVANYVRKVHSVCIQNAEFLKKFMRIIALFTEELIPIEFLKYRLSSLTNDFDEETRKVIEEGANELNPNISASRDALFHRVSKNQNVARALPQEFIVHQNFQPAPMLQLICMLNNVVDDEKIDSCMRCLELFGIQVISRETATAWISQFDAFIGSFFNDTSDASNIAPINFHPAKIAMFAKEELNDSQFQWAVGTHAYEYLQRTVMPKQTTPLQIAVQERQVLKPEDENDEQNAAPYIAELRAVKMCSTMKTIISSSRGSEQTLVDESVLKSIIGLQDLSTINYNPLVYRFLLSKCKAKGAEAVDLFDRINEMNTANMDKSSGDYRVHFKASIQHAPLLRRLILKGLKMKMPSEETISRAQKIVAQFVSNFNEYDGNVENAFSSFSLGSRYVTDTAALAINYILILCDLIEQNEERSPDVDNLANLVMENTTLDKIFPNSTLAHADLILTRIARTINNTGKTHGLNHFSFDAGKMGHLYTGEFLFKVTVTSEITIEEIPYSLRSSNE